MRVLVVEDDAKLGTALRRGLEREGYDVDLARTGPEALEAAGGGAYDTVVLDVMLPGLDGFEVCRELRARERWTPVLMLTARTEVRDRIQGLDAGADDYLVKPFDFGELVARLRALGRRPAPGAHPAFDVGDLRLDPGAGVVTRAGQPVEVTARELAVLEYLARNAGRAVPRAELLEHVWAGHDDPSPNLVDVYVGYLRRKLDRPGLPPVIRTVRGVGFQVDGDG